MSLSTLIACFALVWPTPLLRQTDEDQVLHQSLLAVTEWPGLVERDARATFGVRTAPAAVLELDRRDASERGRAAAVLALGLSRSLAERHRIAELVDNGKAETKIAAVWALGALGSPGDVGKLIDLTGKRAAMAEAALAALALNGTREALAHVRSLAADETNALSGKAKDALGLIAQPIQESELTRAYLDLRFEAARRFGLIDGQAWEVLIVDDLAHHQKFLTRVVLRSASQVRRKGVRDHFLEIALAPAPPERLRGVVAAIPVELSQLLDNELFRPADEREWTLLLEEIERREIESLTEPILRQAFAIESLRARATACLARGGAPGAMQLLDVGLRSELAEERRTAAEALGRVKGESYLPTLLTLEADRDATVRATAWVARARLGDEKALAFLRDALGLDSDKPRLSDLHPDAGALLDALAPCAGDPNLRAIILAVLPRVPERIRAAMGAELVFGGYADVKPFLRDFLRAERPSGALGARVVAAVARDARAPDLALIRDLFPLGDDLDVDVELACLLIELKDAEILPILRSALWSEPWNRSVLAGALWVDVLGFEGLRLELQRPPSGASQRDLRRVGFALGEWGGMAEVDRLSERVGAADPALQGAVLGALGARTH